MVHRTQEPRRVEELLLRTGESAGHSAGYGIAYYALLGSDGTPTLIAGPNDLTKFPDPSAGAALCAYMAA